MRLPGVCDHCDRPATGYFAYWDSGRPGEGNCVSSATCDYHMGDPPGSIPGRCWACGHPIKSSDEYWIYAMSAVYVNFHTGCPRGDDVAEWDGPRTCPHCDDPIAYGQPRVTTHQPRLNRTIYSHQTCEDRHARRWKKRTVW